VRPVSAVDHAVAGARGLAFLLVDVHLLAAGARLLGERQFDQALVDVRHADHQRPVDLARGTAGESLGEERRAAWRARDQQDARGVLVEPVDQARARAALDISVEQPVDVFLDARTALRGEARRLVEHDRGAILRQHHRIGQFDLGLGQFAARGVAAKAGLLLAAGRHAQDLTGRQPGIDVCAFAVDSHLAGARPARNHREADLRQVPLEPAVEPHAFVVVADGELADEVGAAVRAAVGGIVFSAHATLRIMKRPAKRPAKPASSVTPV
jgi:hypothetical protein